MAFSTKYLTSSIEVLEAGGDSITREEGGESRVTWKFVVRGAPDASDAYDAVVSYLQTNFDDGNGGIASYNIPLNSIRLNSTDCDSLYEAECEFSFDEVASEVDTEATIEDYDYSFSTGGGSARITHSLATLGAATSDGSTPRSFGGGIGWNGENFDGVEIATPKVEFSITTNWSKSFFTQAYRLELANATGTINATPWNGFGAGCVLFKGATAKPTAFTYTDENGNTVRDWYWRATYNFEAAPASTVTFGGTTLTKRGFDYVWRVVDKIENASGQVEAKTTQVNIEQVYKEFEFANFNLPFPDEE